jgi:cell division protein FtsB
MKVNVGIWDKLSRAVLFLLFLAGLLTVGVWYFPLIEHNERARRESLRLESEIKKAEETGRSLRLSIESLRNDPKAIERMARERLNKAKPGETVILFEQPATNYASGPQALH